MQVGTIAPQDTLTSLLQDFNVQYEQDPLKADTQKVILFIHERIEKLRQQDENNDIDASFQQINKFQATKSCWLNRPLVIFTDVLSFLANALNVTAAGLAFSANQDSEKQAQAALGTALASTIVAAHVLYIQYLQGKANVRDAEKLQILRTRHDQLVAEEQRRSNKKIQQLLSLYAFLQSFNTLQMNKGEKEFKDCLAKRDGIPLSSKFDLAVPSIGKLVPSLGDAIPGIAIKPVIQEIFNTVILVQSASDEKESKESLHGAKRQLEAQWEKLDKLTGIRVNSFNYMNKTIVRNWKEVEDQQPSTVAVGLTISNPKIEDHSLRTSWSQIYKKWHQKLWDARSYIIQFNDTSNRDNESVTIRDFSNSNGAVIHTFTQYRESSLTVGKIFEILFPDFLFSIQIAGISFIEWSPLFLKQIKIKVIPFEDPINDEERHRVIGKLWSSFLNELDVMYSLKIYRWKRLFTPYRITVKGSEPESLITEAEGSSIYLERVLSANAIKVMSIMSDLEIVMNGDLKSTDSIVRKYRLTDSSSSFIRSIKPANV